MRAEVKKENTTNEFKTKENCFITEVANDSGDEFVSIARARVSPDTITAWHKLSGVSERYIIVSGKGRVEISDLDPIDVTKGDVVRIPADTPQRIKNTGKRDLIFYVVCSPPFDKSCYFDIENTQENPTPIRHNENLITEIILGEISGKNQAIHAYDKIIWTIRTGFLTLLFAGWGILFKSIISNNTFTQDNYNQILLAILFISVFLSSGGLIIDLNYLKRKFRVVFALDSLLFAILRKGKEILQFPNNLADYIQVSGDKDNSNYQKVSGYNSACKAGFAIYIIPILVASICVLLLW